MVVLPDHARQRNNFQIIPLSRPRIERERDAGVETLRGRQPGGTRVVANDPSKVEGRAMTVVQLPREYREPPPPEREPQLELWPDLPATPRRATPSSLLAEIKQEFAALYEHVDAICAHADAIHLGFALLDSLYEPNFVPRPWPHLPRPLGDDPLPAGPRERPCDDADQHCGAPSARAGSARRDRADAARGIPRHCAPSARRDPPQR